MLYIWLISGDLFVESQKLDFDSSLYLVQDPPPLLLLKRRNKCYPSQTYLAAAWVFIITLIINAYGEDIFVDLSLILQIQ